MVASKWISQNVSLLMLLQLFSMKKCMYEMCWSYLCFCCFHGLEHIVYGWNIFCWSHICFPPYSFVTASGKCYCVDPKASWLPERLQRLQNVSLHNKLLLWNLPVKETYQGNRVCADFCAPIFTFSFYLLLFTVHFHWLTHC